MVFLKVITSWPSSTCIGVTRLVWFTTFLPIFCLVIFVCALNEWNRPYKIGRCLKIQIKDCKFLMISFFFTHFSFYCPSRYLEWKREKLMNHISRMRRKVLKYYRSQKWMLLWPYIFRKYSLYFSFNKLSFNVFLLQ